MSRLIRLPGTVTDLAPTYSAPYLPTSVSAEGEVEGLPIPFSHYLWIIRRHCWSILAFVVVCVLLSFTISSRLTPIYESTATLVVDRQAPSVLIGQDANREVVAQSDADQFMTTQIKLIQSDAVLRPVAEKFHLLEHEKQLEKLDSERAYRASRAPVVLNRLKIIRPANTYLLRISYRSPDPQLSADVANAIANSYIDHTFNIRIRSSKSVSSFMEKQIEGMKARMELSGQALGKFERELNVINPDEKTNILSARLLQLNQEYTAAQADRIRKETAYNAAKTGALEAVQVSSQGEALSRLTDKINDARQRFAQLKSTYGPNHPEFRKAASELNELESQFRTMRDNLAGRIEVEYKQALNREQMLKADVMQTKTEYDQLNARSFEYQALKREAEADKTLYDELVRKIREAGINAGFQDSNIRIADLARPPVTPVSPRVLFNVVLAFFCSVVLAIGAAVLLDVMDTTVRDPEQASRYLGTDVIGILPAVRNGAHLTDVASNREMTVSEDPRNYDNGYDRKRYYRTISGFEEAIRTVRNSILLGDMEQRLRSILLTSAAPGDGKTTAAVHLAIAHADQGRRTLLIDADLRRPSVHRKFTLPNDMPGFSSVLTGESAWRDVVVNIKSKPNLDIMPAGLPSHRAADLISNRIADILDECQKVYDLVIVDAPPLLGFAEPLQVATATDGVLIIGKAGVTQRNAIRSVIAGLRRVRANIIGLVLNQVKRENSNSYSYYGYYQTRYYASSESDAVSVAEPRS